jgi:tetratricopeptide (TPR) repeat protein
MDDRLKELLTRGRDLYEKRDFDAAEPLLSEVAAAGLPFADVYDMLGVMAHTQGDFLMAEQHFRHAVTINPRYTEALLNLAITLNDRRKYDEARQIFDRLSTRTPRGTADIEPFARGKLANMHADLAQAYADMSLLDDAVEQLEKAVRLCPTFADLRTKLGVLYRDTGKLDLATEEFREAIVSNPRYARAFVLLGSTLLASGDREGARVAWQGALEVEPENLRAASFLRMLDGETRTA